tara:strand:+ start:2330 stop:2500 length:171 start_codon:yes stop_codon:yes gene_type:complete
MSWQRNKEIITIYNNLIEQAKLHLGKSINVEWGTWTPTIKGLSTLISRRDKLRKGE